MRAKFIRGGDPVSSMGIGRYREMQGLPPEIQKTIILLREMGYFREDYNNSFHLRTERDQGINQFFWDYTEDSYNWRGAKLLWSSLFWIPLKSPNEFYDSYGNIGKNYINNISLEASLTIDKIDPDSSTAKYYGGPIAIELKLNAGRDFSDLSKSYEKNGINTSEEVNEFISKKIRNLETYVKKMLKRNYLN